MVTGGAGRSRVDDAVVDCRIDRKRLVELDDEIIPEDKSVFCRILIGVAVLVVGVKRRDYLLMVGGMLWAAGNMYYYAMLYLLPVLVIELFSRVERVEGEEVKVKAEGEERKWWIWIELGLWLALLSPLQVVVLGHSANQVIGNVALMGLMGIRLVCGGNCLAAKNAKSAKIVAV